MKKKVLSIKLGFYFKFCLFDCSWEIQLLTKLEISKKDKERIAIDYENEEECISNKLQDKLFDLQKVNSDLVKKNEELAIMLQRHVAH